MWRGYVVQIAEITGEISAAAWCVVKFWDTVKHIFTTRRETVSLDELSSYSKQ